MRAGSRDNRPLRKTSNSAGSSPVSAPPAAFFVPSPRPSWKITRLTDERYLDLTGTVRAGSLWLMRSNQPAYQFRLGSAAELAKVVVSLQEGLLDHIRGADLTLEPAVDLRPGQQREVIAVELQKLSQSLAVPGLCQAQHLLGVLTDAAHGHDSPMKLDANRLAIPTQGIDFMLEENGGRTS
jgi:hypothetical protein